MCGVRRISSGQTSSATPAKPSARPMRLGTDSGWPFAPSVPSQAIQSARLEFSSATSFEGRCFRAYVDEPLLRTTSTSE